MSPSNVPLVLVTRVPEADSIKWPRPRQSLHAPVKLRTWPWGAGMSPMHLDSRPFVESGANYDQCMCRCPFDMTPSIYVLYMVVYCSLRGFRQSELSLTTESFFVIFHQLIRRPEGLPVAALFLQMWIRQGVLCTA